MWGIATFTMLVSKSSSTDASDTVIAMMYLYLYRSTSAPEPGCQGAVSTRPLVATVRLLGRDRDHYAHARAQRVCGVVLRGWPAPPPSAQPPGRPDQAGPPAPPPEPRPPPEPPPRRHRAPALGRCPSPPGA